jgi:FixJ family two-component response regulator
VPLVAVVDDEKPVRTALRRLLRAAGMEAEAFASGAEFFEGAALRRPECVVLDLHLAGMGGQQILERIRRMADPVPVIIITAHDTDEARARCLAAGAAAYLCKPLDDRLLLNAISAAIGKASSGRKQILSSKESPS